MVGTFAVLQVATSWVTYRFKPVRTVLEGEPLIVVRQNETGAGSIAGLEPGATVFASWAVERNLIVRDDAEA